ncbi:MAG TPA: beta-phosphoglucomutase family hydrolase [Polyangiaceae bacterium]|nr:beta-phosphoglucomutase family hydrolase [Polyangiaceae bacterium]
MSSNSNNRWGSSGADATSGSASDAGAHYDAVLFDLDGVLTGTARVHEAAWKETFDAFLKRWGARTGKHFEPFTQQDYLLYVDGRSRLDGARSFLASRSIDLPEHAPDHVPGAESLEQLADLKNRRAVDLIRPDTVEVFPGSVAVVRAARVRGIKTAVVSASQNCRAVLAAAGIGDLFDTVVDGKVVAEKGLRGKPAPDPFLEAARQLDVAPANAVVVEDALAGVRAGREGGFGLVIGVDRRGNAAALRQAGAQLVVADLFELLAGLMPGKHGPKLHKILETAQKIATAETLMIQQPWQLVLRGPAAELTPQLESILALSNGYLGVRGTMEEGFPNYRPATLLNGFHETWPIRHPEDAYGFARTGQTIVPAPDGTRIRLFADDSQIDMRDEMASFQRTLHLDRAVLERELVWRLGDGSRLRVRSTRLVSLVNRHLVCMTYEVEPLDRAVSLTVSSELVVPEAARNSGESMDPRRRRLDECALDLESSEITGDGVVCTFRTRQSGQSLACGMAHRAVVEAEYEHSVKQDPNIYRYLLSARLEPGQRIRLEKFLAYHYSSGRSRRELSFRTEQTLAQARRTGADAVRNEHERAVSNFWHSADVELVGSPSLQFAVRYSIFQLMQATARVEGYGLPAKGLTGEGYEGHYFWDTEIYVVPFLTYTSPRVARALLLKRYRMLDDARERAHEVGQRGALFAWRTINGKEASAYYAAGTAQYHIDADVAFALQRYVELTGDKAFMEDYGGEILVETARLWADLGFFSDSKHGQFVINGVTGPDEYSTVVDNNAFTNLMARKNMQIAVDALETLQRENPDRYDHLANSTRLAAAEIDLWRRAAAAMYVPYDDEARVHLQDESFLEQQAWDFATVPPEMYPLLLHFHPLYIYRHQVIKQADVMLAAFLLGNEFTDEQKRRIFEYYDPLTTGDSSLSECIQSIAACEVGEVAVAHRYLVDSATTDLADLHHNVRDGMHVASCGGTWMAVVYGFAGLRDYSGHLTFKPAMPPHWQKLRFRLRVRGALLEVTFTGREATYRLLEGGPLDFHHRDELVVLAPGAERRLLDPNMQPEVWSKSQTAVAASGAQLAAA